MKMQIPSLKETREGLSLVKDIYAIIFAVAWIALLLAPAPFWATWGLLAFGGFILLFTSITSVMQIRELHKFNRRFAASSHRIFHALRNGYQDLLHMESECESNDMITAKVQHTCEEILGNVVEILNDAYKNAEFSACIKLFKGEDVVITFARDSHSRDKRQINGEHKIKLNSDFHYIMNNEKKITWFYSKDLTALDNYMNDRVEWQKHYKSAVVLPIQLPANGQKAKIVGFLCADTLKVAAFSEQPTVDFLACVADSLYPLLAHYRIALSKET